MKLPHRKSSALAYSAVLCLLVLCYPSSSVVADDPTYAGVQYGDYSGVPLLLDLYLPQSLSSADAFPTIVWVHGGAWRKGSRNSVPIAPLTDAGFAIASVDYRLTPVARFPAQVLDIRAAIEFLRENHERYRLDSSRMAIAGASAGGHLAALVGVSEGVDFQGEGKQASDRRSDQQSGLGAIVSFYGASNLQTILSQSTPHGLSVRVPALGLLLGAQPKEAKRLAQWASPVFHVDKDDPPLFLLHGDQDPQMPINQAHELVGVYEENGLEVQFRVLHGAAHGGAQFYSTETLAEVSRFLREIL